MIQTLVGLLSLVLRSLSASLVLADAKTQQNINNINISTNVSVHTIDICPTHCPKSFYFIFNLFSDEYSNKLNSFSPYY